MVGQFSGNFNYGYTMEPFIAGQVTDAADRITSTESCQTDTLRYGVVVVYSQTHPYVELPSAGNTNIAGAIQHFILDRLIPGTPPTIPAKLPLPCLKQGKIAMQIDDDFLTVKKTDPVYVRLTANGANKLPGQIRKDNADGSFLWTPARYTGRIIPGKLVEVSILLPT